MVNFFSPRKEVSKIFYKQSKAIMLAHDVPCEYLVKPCCGEEMEL